jgi:uncharacterized membrane protein YhaH (DUF805 family)
VSDKGMNKIDSCSKCGIQKSNPGELCPVCEIEVRKIDENSAIQNNIFKFKGVIGRKYYLINSLILILISAFLFSLIYVNLIYYRSTEALMSALFINYIISICILFPLYYFNTIKRIADIKGTRKGSAKLTGAIIILGMCRYIGIAVLLISTIFLTLIKGKITSNVK